jgi:hypothetical protein
VPKFSLDLLLACLALAVAIVLYMLDKSGKSGPLINTGLLILLAVLLVFLALSILWIPSPTAWQVWRMALAVCTAVFIVSAFGIWTWPRPSTQTTAVSSPEPPAEGPPNESAGIEFHAHILSTPPAHPPNTILGGISWKQDYTDLRLDVINGSNPAQNLNIKITLDNDEGIAAVGQLSHFPAITIFPAQDKPYRDGRALAPTGLRMMTEQGIFPPDPFDEEDSTIRHAYRIHCDNLFPESTLRLIIAAPSEVPSTIHIVGSYETSGPDGLQTHPIDITQPVSKD